MKNSDNSSAPIHELEFAYKVRRALDERAANLPAHTTQRLVNARKLAIKHKKAHVPEIILQHSGVFAGTGSLHINNPFNNPLTGSFRWLKRAGMAIPLIILIIGALSIYQVEHQRRLHALADIDAAVLTDELPLNAYLDHGFDSYINKHGE